MALPVGKVRHFLLQKLELERINPKRLNAELSLGLHSRSPND